MLLSIYRLVLSGSNVVSGLRQRNGCFCYVTIFWFFRHMVHPPKNSGWLPGTDFTNECKAEPLADFLGSGSRELVLQTNAKQNHSLTTTCRPEGWWDLSPPHIFKESRKKSTVIVPKMLQIRPRNPLKMEAGATLLDARKARGYPKSRFEERSRSGADGVS